MLRLDSTERPKMDKKRLNLIALTILAPLLLLVGVAGFVVPSQYSVMSSATPYNLFHIVFGAIGLFLLSLRKDRLITLFNFGFGLIDLYQAIASVVGLTPIEYFLWTPTDDLVHLALGTVLSIIGFYGIREWKEKERA
jgi:hypothetical protein